jgi:hypothetical protein
MRIVLKGAMVLFPRYRLFLVYRSETSERDTIAVSCGSVRAYETVGKVGSRAYRDGNAIKPQRLAASLSLGNSGGSITCAAGRVGIKSRSLLTPYGARSRPNDPGSWGMSVQT